MPEPGSKPTASVAKAKGPSKSKAPGPPRFFQRVLLPIDGSVSSLMVAEWGLRFAKLFGASAFVMQARPTPVMRAVRT